MESRYVVVIRDRQTGRDKIHQVNKLPNLFARLGGRLRRKTCTRAEDEFIAQNYRLIGPSEIARRLGKTKNVIIGRYHHHLKEKEHAQTNATPAGSTHQDAEVRGH